MKVLVTGAGGQVGREILARAAADGTRAVGMDRRDLDIAEADAVRRSLDTHRPDVVVNAAAYTAVDRAEAEPEAAFRTNRDGPAVLAAACAEAGLPLIHLSTDYVFDGQKGTPYVETDPVAPLGVYGRSKAAGEDAVRQRLDRHVIVRTAWVVSVHGHNFVKTVLRLARERDALRIVADQWGHPTWAGDVAHAALAAARQAAGGAEPWGTVHYAGHPLTTWHGLASAVVAEAGALDPQFAVPVEPIPTVAYPTPAARPPRVELDMARAHAVLGLGPPDWRAPVRAVVRRLVDPDPSRETGVD